MNTSLAKSVVAVALLGGACSAQTTLSDVRFWSLGEVTRVAIEFSTLPEFGENRISNPDRIFYDFIDTQPRINGRYSASLAVNDPRLRQIRVGETKPGVTRLVLDLTANIVITKETLSNPTRLILELRQKGSTPSVVSSHPVERSNVPSAPALRANAPSTPVTAEVTSPAPVNTPSRHAAGRRYWHPSPPVVHPPGVVTWPPELPVATVSSNVALLSLPIFPRSYATHPALALNGTPPRLQPSPSSSSTAVSPVAVAARASSSSTKASATNPAPSRTTPTIERRAQPAAQATSSMTRALGLKIRRVVLDAGHGGHDQGTAGPTGLTEKEVVLDITLRLGRILTDTMGIEVIYTRQDDRFIPLEQRTKIANESRADLFLSIHANSSPVKSVSGVETFFLSFTTAKDALETAARENASSSLGVFELRELLQKIALKEKINESREFATRINNALYRSWYNGSPRVQNRGVKRAPFVVLIGANMPSVLAEIGFLSNARDEKDLRKPEIRQKVAEALSKGIAQYASSLSHFQVARAGDGE